MAGEHEDGGTPTASASVDVQPGQGSAPPPTAVPAPDKAPRRRDPGGWLALLLGGGALVVLGTALLARRAGLGDAQGAIALLPWLSLGSLLALLVIAITWRRRRARERTGPWPRLLLGGVFALVVLVYSAGWLWARLSHPDIHDISTNLADPPPFTEIALRPDNLDAVPGADESTMAGMTPLQRWGVIHQRSYPDIRSVRIGEPMLAVMARAARLADARGWKVETIDPVRGLMEARAYSTLMRLPQDIVLRASPVDGGDATVVDIRVVSETGIADYGLNAQTIRDFLSDLAGRTTALPSEG